MPVCAYKYVERRKVCVYFFRKKKAMKKATRLIKAGDVIILSAGLKLRTDKANLTVIPEFKMCGKEAEVVKVNAESIAVKFGEDRYRIMKRTTVYVNIPEQNEK
jgi:hypothetical protein